MDPNDTIPAELRKFFEENRSPALGFSGGADSSYLFYAAVVCGADVTAYFVKSQFQSMRSLEEALRTAQWLGRPVTVIPSDAVGDPDTRSNPSNRCYYCRKREFTLIKEQAAKDGKTVVIDANNASDNPEGRPGMKALRELGVVSPLRLCNITKPEVRRLSKKAGLWTWDLPSNSCLASRIITGVELTEDNLRRAEHTEELLRELGFRDIRIRTDGESARLDVTDAEKALLDTKRNEVEKIILSNYSSAEFGTRKAGL